MIDMIKDKEVSELEEKLQLRKALVDITNRIHAAQNIKQILVDLKDGILNLFSAHSITIYVVDQPRKEIYSMFLIGTQVKEIRVPINNRSIAGYVANTGKTVNIGDAYDVAELKLIDKDLAFDLSWDKKSGFRTKQILAAPIIHNNTLMGVLQILNKKRGNGKFSDDERGFLQEISDVLAVAFFNQERYARRRKTRFDYLISHDLIKEEVLDSAWEESREAKEPIEDYLMKKFTSPGRTLAAPSRSSSAANSSPSRIEPPSRATCSSISRRSTSAGNSGSRWRRRTASSISSWTIRTTSSSAT